MKSTTQKGMFALSGTNFKSAIIYGLLAMIIGFLFAVANAILDAHTIFGLDWKAIIDKGAIEALGLFVLTLSIIKNLLTNAKGKFLGLVAVIPDKDY